MCIIICHCVVTSADSATWQDFYIVCQYFFGLTAWGQAVFHGEGSVMHGEGNDSNEQLTGGANGTNEHKILTSRTKMSYVAVWVGLVHGQGSHAQCV